jgi:hypothetical protein
MQAELTANPVAMDQQDFAGSRLVRKLLRFNPEFSLHRTVSPDRCAVEQHIAKVFAESYGAQVTEFSPFLMSMVCAGNVSAAAGFRPADTGPLFLEQYLDGSIEVILSNCYGKNLDRHAIFELGNLAALRPGVCQIFYLIMAGVIARTKLNYVVFAGTRQVAKGLDRLGFQMDRIAAADPSRLGDAARNWGSYYDSKPEVMAIDLEKSMEALGQMPIPRALLGFYEPQIAELASHFNAVYRQGI